MKKISFISFLFLSIAIVACNNADKKQGDVKLSPKGQADSLEKEVLEGHDVAMPKSMRIPDVQKEIKRLVDSISKLPAKAQEAAAPYKSKLEDIYKELGDAYASMESWMNEFNYDSAKDNIEQRIKYLTEEKLRVGKVKDAVVGSLQKADALLKEKF